MNIEDVDEDNIPFVALALELNTKLRTGNKANENHWSVRDAHIKHKKSSKPQPSDGRVLRILFMRTQIAKTSYRSPPAHQTGVL